jgi:hypothetical protein
LGGCHPRNHPIFPELQDDNMTFGLSVYFSRRARDQVYAELGKAGIGLTIHWEDTCKGSVHQSKSPGGGYIGKYCIPIIGIQVS